MYNKNNLAIHKLASDKTNPRLNTVAFYGNKTVATNSHALIEVSSVLPCNSYELPVLYWVDDVKKLKADKKTILWGEKMDIAPAPLHGQEFPDLKKVYESTMADKYEEVTLNGEYLEKVASILKNINKYSRVTIKVPKEKNKAVIVEAKSDKVDGQSGRALIMPVRD